jgi:hypothetical protein
MNRFRAAAIVHRTASLHIPVSIRRDRLTWASKHQATAMPTFPPPIELPRPNLAAYSEAQIRFAVEAWPMRAAEELRSALIFRALARAARCAHLVEPWPSRFLDAMRDEVRHARLCAVVGERLGATKPLYDATPVRARVASHTDPIARTASLLLVEVAIGETISMLLFRAGRRAATEPLTRAALGSILSDEVRHQRLGWTAASALWPMLTDSHRNALQREVSRGLAALEQRIARPALRRLEADEPFEPAYACLGVLDPEKRVEAFYFATERLVVPRLSRLGLDGAAMWASRYRGT